MEVDVVIESDVKALVLLALNIVIYLNRVDPEPKVGVAKQVQDDSVLVPDPLACVSVLQGRQLLAITNTLMITKTITIKRVHIYNILLLSWYLWIRFKVFILEDKRKLIGEFSKEDAVAEHYVLFIGKKASGIVRIIHKGHEATIGRFGLFNHHRNKGYGTKFIRKIINHIKKNRLVVLISLLAEDKNKGFYEKVGFLTKEILCIEGYPYNKMIIYVT